MQEGEVGKYRQIMTNLIWCYRDKKAKNKKKTWSTTEGRCLWITSWWILRRRPAGRKEPTTSRYNNLTSDGTALTWVGCIQWRAVAIPEACLSFAFGMQFVSGGWRFGRDGLVTVHCTRGRCVCGRLIFFQCIRVDFFCEDGATLVVECMKKKNKIEEFY